jgi:hypothetical protein
MNSLSQKLRLMDALTTEDAASRLVDDHLVDQVAEALIEEGRPQPRALIVEVARRLAEKDLMMVPVALTPAEAPPPKVSFIGQLRRAFAQWRARRRATREARPIQAPKPPRARTWNAFQKGRASRAIALNRAPSAWAVVYWEVRQARMKQTVYAAKSGFWGTLGVNVDEVSARTQPLSPEHQKRLAEAAQACTDVSALNVWVPQWCYDDPYGAYAHLPILMDCCSSQIERGAKALSWANDWDDVFLFCHLLSLGVDPDAVFENMGQPARWPSMGPQSLRETLLYTHAVSLLQALAVRTKPVTDVVDSWLWWVVLAHHEKNNDAFWGWVRDQPQSRSEAVEATIEWVRDHENAPQIHADILRQAAAHDTPLRPMLMRQLSHVENALHTA